MLTPRPPTSEKVAPIQQRPLTAQQSRRVVAKQLRCSLSEAKSTPPIGVDAAEVAKKEHLVQKLLTAVELAQQNAFVERQRTAQERKRSAENQEAERMKKILYSRRMRHVQYLFARAANDDEMKERFEEKERIRQLKFSKCAYLKGRSRVDAIEKSQENSYRRQRRLNMVDHMRSEKVNSLRTKRQQDEERACENRLRREELEELDHERKKTLSKVRDQHPIRCQNAREQMDVADRCVDGHSLRSHILFGGHGVEPKVVTVRRNHHQRLLRQNERDKSEKDRLEEDAELKKAFSDAIQARNAERIERRNRNYNRLVDANIQKCNNLVDRERAKDKHVQIMQNQQKQNAERHRVEKDRDISEHQKRCSVLIQNTNDEIATRTLHRWENRAADAIATIMDRFGSDMEPADE